MDAFLDFMMQHRSWWIVPLVLPISFAVRMCEWLLTLLKPRRVTMQQHLQRVEKLVSDVQESVRKGCKRLCTARTAHAQMGTRLTGRFKRSCDGQIDVSNLDSIVEINADERYMIVQPYCNSGTITAALLPLGLQMPVVAEMDKLTVGGLCLGYGIESSSHRVGLFFDANVIEVELVTGNGDLISCRADNEHAELFRSLPWSYGTLGFAVTFKLRLIDAKPFIRLTYEKVLSFEDAQQRALELCAQSDAPQYLEGLAFARNHTVLVYGDLLDAPPAGASVYRPYSNWSSKWFHHHVRDHTVLNDTYTVVMPLGDYLHRFYRSLFWEVELILPFAHKSFFRHTLGFLLPPSVSHLKMLQTEKLFEQLNRDHIVQDVLVPCSQTAATLHKCADLFDVWPLWFVLHEAPPTGGLMRPSPRNAREMFTDVGIWGVPACVLDKSNTEFDGEEQTMRLEKWTRDVDGVQCLYATTFQNEAEFRQMFEHSQYERLRKQYNADCFPTLYDKVRRRSQ